MLTCIKSRLCCAGDCNLMATEHGRYGPFCMQKLQSAFAVNESVLHIGVSIMFIAAENGTYGLSCMQKAVE